MLALEWKTITPSREPAHWIKGTELEMAYIPKTRSRLAVYSVRTYDAERNADVLYRVRDAGKISDADVKTGNRPPIVAEYPTLDDLERAIAKARLNHPNEFERN